MSNEHPRGFTTAILHSDRDAAIEHGALHKPLHLSVAYGYRDARELAAVFQGKAQGLGIRRLQLFVIFDPPADDARQKIGSQFFYIELHLFTLASLPSGRCLRIGQSV